MDLTAPPAPGPDTLRAVADHIERHPDSYDQHTYGLQEPGCGTRACIAGWALILQLGEDLALEDWADGGRVYRYLIDTDRLPDRLRHLRSVTALHCAVKQHALAADLLGLTEKDARKLFDCGWRPPEGMTVPDALRRLADGAALADVTSGEVW